jgi:hypothetical protein
VTRIWSKLTERCSHCGNDVSWGSGRFVNRVPDLNDVVTRIVLRRLWPLGCFVCEVCDTMGCEEEDSVPSGTEA